MRSIRSAIAVTVVIAATSAPAIADEIGAAIRDVPIFDAHMHYNKEAWASYPAKTVIELMDRTGVAMALVSSAPDDGTIKLLEHAPARVVPELRPYHGHVDPPNVTQSERLLYKIQQRVARVAPELWPDRTSADKWNWTKSEGMLDYIWQRLKIYPHEGIGEIHVHRLDPSDRPLLKAVAKIAKDRRIPVHIHSGAGPIRLFFELEPALTIIWAHAGWEHADKSESAKVVGAMFDEYATLYADTSYREQDILTHDGAIEPVWRDVIMRHSDRLMVGTDTWNNGQWDKYKELVDLNRRWLSKLPRDVAERIAYKNAERVFNRKISTELLGTR